MEKKIWWLLISSLIAVLVIYFTDVICTNLGWVQSSMLSSVLDLLKYISATLIGYLLALWTSKEQK